jgi:hypothetical protein
MEVFIPLEKLTLQEFVERTKASAKITVSKSGKEFSNISRRKQHWIHLIETNNLVCPATGKKVSYCSYDRKDTKNSPPSFHYNFYSEDDELFSIDHKLPISKGGSITNVDNIQPMIMVENNKKCSQLIYL